MTKIPTGKDLDKLSELRDFLKKADEVDEAPTVAELHAFAIRMLTAGAEETRDLLTSDQQTAVRTVLGVTSIKDHNIDYGNDRFNTLDPAGFVHKSTPLKFKHMDRTTIALQLLARIADINLIEQGDQPICGAVTVVKEFAGANINEYVGYVIGLAEDGEATIKTKNATTGLTVEVADRWPSSNILNKKLDRGKKGSIREADYIALVSLRNAVSVLPYDAMFTNTTLQGAAYLSELETWMKNMGYGNVQKHSLTLGCLRGFGTQAQRDRRGRATVQDNLKKAEHALSNGHSVIIAGAGNLAYYGLGDTTRRTGHLATVFAGHFMVMRSLTIVDRPNTSDDGVTLRIATWGEESPSGVLVPWSKMASWYWGFVSGQP